MHRNQGFTLIEIIIALSIFATIAVITSSVLYESFKIRERVTIQSEQLSTLQLAITLLQRDTAQLVFRPVRGNEMHLFPALIGQANYLEFTRGGAVNPMSLEQRSTLKRVAYLCEQGKFIRRIWSQLDTPDRDDYHDNVLLNNLKTCSFAYMGSDNIMKPVWYQVPSPTNMRKKPRLPKAVQLTITLKNWGKMILLLPASQT
ncbi:MAG: GspJ family T2SS minor pseudopilin variant LspJ [Legionellaceae bacterium]|nr:GspJ family T2SS minor pseudopilin variant LspJ [Legionellaceae bacterium]